MSARWVALALVLLIARAGAQEDDEARARAELERTGWVLRAAERFAEGRSDQGEQALSVWAWRLEAGAPGRVRVLDAVDSCRGAARELLEALVDPPPLPDLDAPAVVADLLVAPAGETTLERAVRSARFTRALDRVGVAAALEGLEPTASWMAEVRARWEREASRVAEIEALVGLLALPFDPRTAERVVLWPPRENADDGG